jgi:flagellar hook-basal body complex protein FliE
MDPEVGETEEAGFDAAMTTQEPTETPEPDEVVFVEPAQEPEPEYAQITKAQLDDLMAKANKADVDKAFGKIGVLHDVVAALQKSTSAGQSIEVTADDFSELREEFPELADLQAKGLNKILSKFKGTGVDTEAIDKMVSERVSAVRQQTIDASLDAIVDGDWTEAVNSDKYKAWIATQAADVKALEASDSVRDAAKLLRMFKSYAPARAQEPKPSTRTQQLAAAVNPKGAGGNTSTAPTTEEDAFNAAWKGG